MQHTLSTCVSGPSPVWLQAAFPVLFPGTSYSRSLQLQQNHHSSPNLPPCQQLRPGLTETFALASPKWTYPLVLSAMGSEEAPAVAPGSVIPTQCAQHLMQPAGLSPLLISSTRSSSWKVTSVLCSSRSHPWRRDGAFHKAKFRDYQCPGVLKSGDVLSQAVFKLDP